MRFTEKLASACIKNKSMLCVGLDTDPAQLPDGVTVFEFNKAIIDATVDTVCAYKPNFAFYEAMGNEGWEALKRTVEYIPPNIPVIADAKRGDIGNTAKAYASAIFTYLKFDAVTVSPYLGFDSVEPFLQYADKGVFILCRTSNAGAADFQSLICETETGKFPLYQIVADKANKWNRAGNIGLVVGATYPEELKSLRGTYPNMPFLIPGVGAQGGDLATTIRNGADTRGELTIINSSRQIIYASRGRDFAAGARRAAMAFRDEVIHEMKAKQEGR